MTYDIIDITEAEADALETVQLKMLRTAQQKKNELYHKLQAELAEYMRICRNTLTADSSAYDTVSKELTDEYNYQVEILREQLVFNMSMREPTTDGETGGTGSDDTGYLVDYELSYIERYVAVRDYYLTIEDPNERLALLAKDEVARKYLGSYYTTLYDYFVGLAN